MIHREYRWFDHRLRRETNRHHLWCRAGCDVSLASFSIVETHLDSHLGTAFLAVWVGKKSTCFPWVCFKLMSDAMQVGSGKAPWSELCLLHVFPRSWVVETARPLVAPLPSRFLLSRMLSMSEPSDSSAIAHSVVLSRAWLETCQVFPWSLLHVRFENGRPLESRPCVGMT